MAWGATWKPHAVPVFTLSGPHPDHTYDTPCAVEDGAAIHTIRMESGEHLSCIVVGSNEGRGQKQHLLPVLDWDGSPISMPRLLHTVITGEKPISRLPKSLADIKPHHYVARPWHGEQQDGENEALLVGLFQPLDLDTKLKKYEIDGDHQGRLLLSPDLYHRVDQDTIEVLAIVDCLLKSEIRSDREEDKKQIRQLLEQEGHTTIPMMGSVPQILAEGRVAPTKSGSRGQTPQTVMFISVNDPILLRAPFTEAWRGETDPLCVMYDGETVRAMWFSGRVSAEQDGESPMPDVLGERYWM
jgi:hypothetical protein